MQAVTRHREALLLSGQLAHVTAEPVFVLHPPRLFQIARL
jgi:hypothetical protein